METMQKLNPYLNEMANRYTAWFDVYRHDRLGSIPLAFSAHFKRRDEKYLVTKTIKVWSMENDQHVYVTSLDRLVTVQDIENFKQELLKIAQEQSPDRPEHMSTVHTGVIVTNEPVSQEVKRSVKKFRKLKFIKYGLHGWYEIFIGVVDTQNREAYIHSKGKEFIKPFIQSLGN